MNLKFFFFRNKRNVRHKTDETYTTDGSTKTDYAIRVNHCSRRHRSVRLAFASYDSDNETPAESRPRRACARRVGRTESHCPGRADGGVKLNFRARRVRIA